MPRATSTSRAPASRNGTANATPRNTSNGAIAHSTGLPADQPTGLAQDIGKRRPFEQLEAEVFLNLVRTTEHLSAELNLLFKQHGLSGPKYNVLRILRGHGTLEDGCEGIACQKIAEQMITREPDITRLLDRLFKDDLIERTRCERDRRVVLVRITKKGHDLLAVLDGAVHQIHERQLAHLPRPDLERLNDLLYRARQPAAS